MKTLKTNREAIWYKYGKRCAYCGRKIKFKEMQIDHIIPKSWNKESPDDPSNLNPSCKRCNFYKSNRSLEKFRQLLLTIYNRLIKIYIFKIAMDYGLIKFTKWDGKFFYETLEERKEDIDE